MMDGRSPGARFCGFGSLKNSFGLLRKRMTGSSTKRLSRRKLGGRKRRREKGKKNGRKLSGQRVSSRKLERWMRGSQNRSGRRNQTGWGRKKQSIRRFPRKRKGRKKNSRSALGRRSFLLRKAGKKRNRIRLFPVRPILASGYCLGALRRL